MLPLLGVIAVQDLVQDNAMKKILRVTDYVVPLIVTRLMSLVPLTVDQIVTLPIQGVNQIKILVMAVLK